jgi:hypothetical protein
LCGSVAAGFAAAPPPPAAALAPPRALSPPPYAAGAWIAGLAMAATVVRNACHAYSPDS